MLTVIVPVYNEADILQKNQEYFQRLGGLCDLIFVDGCSRDQTLKWIPARARVLTAPKNRARQMNAGAAAARQDVLLFLHADAMIPEEYFQKIEAAVQSGGSIGGCLSQVLDDPAWIYRWIALTGNVRAKIFKIFYGDQGIFVRKDIFLSVGGFPEVKICEDILFTKRLRNAGNVGILPFPVICSARRWKRRGILKTFFVNARITAALMLGAHPDRFSSLYSDEGKEPA